MIEGVSSPAPRIGFHPERETLHGAGQWLELASVAVNTGDGGPGRTHWPPAPAAELI